ncbi:hypothetical protein AGMMS49579_23470 [Spirochaetia bacterium]|nr:hypothetical protein AGMMS49579_23470 [Spirochaetia bacterium]
MEIKSTEEIKEWLDKNYTNKIFQNYKKIISKSIPVDAGIKNYISKSISSLLNNEECMLYIHEHGIWPSCENMELFDGYRKSIGINEELYEKPVHIIATNENIELYCLLTMVLYFFWGCIIMSNNENIIIEISHDECIDIYFKNGYNNEEFITKINEIMKEE